MKKPHKTKSTEKSPAYIFFAEASDEVRAKAYSKALKDASDEQAML